MPPSAGAGVPPGEPSAIHAIESWLAHDAEAVIASSKFMVSEVVDGFELPAERSHRIPNGIDPTWWSTGARPSERSPLVFTWGRVQYEKGFQVLARAMSLLRARVPGIECIIGGRGSYLPELQSQIDLEGVSDLVHLPGFLPDDLLRSTVHRAECVAVPSLYEPFGIVALEALAGGAPLVVARTGGLAELIEGTGAGLLFEPGNADELAACVEKVLTDHELADEMRRRGSALLADRYSWNAIAGATAAVYANPSSP
jgi:glycogen synthase